MKITTTRKRAISERAIIAATQKGLLAAVQEWHQTMRPGHFKPSAVGKYGYAPRTKKYMIRKARAKRHQDPLRYSGDSQRQSNVGRFSTAMVGGNPMAFATMAMPSYFVQHPNRGGLFIDKPDELTRTTPEERDQLSHTIRSTALRELGMGARASA